MFGYFLGFLELERLLDCRPRSSLALEAYDIASSRSRSTFRIKNEPKAQYFFLHLNSGLDQ